MLAHMKGFDPKKEQREMQNPNRNTAWIIPISALSRTKTTPLFVLKMDIQELWLCLWCWPVLAALLGFLTSLVILQLVVQMVLNVWNADKEKPLTINVSDAHLQKLMNIYNDMFKKGLKHKWRML